jgi:uncharacterized protein YsxB (DUF464 family)
MITVKYQRDAFRISIEGHARSGEFGKDLICASATILTHTMADVVSSMESAGYCSSSNAHIESGKADIACTPLPEYTDSVLIAMDAVATGFGILAHYYPEFVDMETEGI